MREIPNDSWTLMGSHGVVLFYIAANPNATMREMADSLMLTERRITGIVRDLATSGMIEVSKSGRRNSYQVNGDAHFRHPTLSHVKLSTFVQALEGARGHADSATEDPRRRADQP